MQAVIPGEAMSCGRNERQLPFVGGRSKFHPGFGVRNIDFHSSGHELAGLDRANDSDCACQGNPRQFAAYRRADRERVAREQGFTVTGTRVRICLPRHGSWFMKKALVRLTEV